MVTTPQDLIPNCECGKLKILYQGWICPNAKCAEATQTTALVTAESACSVTSLAEWKDELRNLVNAAETQRDKMGVETVRLSEARIRALNFLAK